MPRAVPESFFPTSFGLALALGVEIESLSGALPAHFYHYTDLAGLVGIVDEGGIFLSDARFLNDSSELDFGRQAIVDAVRRAPDPPADSRAAAQVRQILGEIREGQ